jgi:hypothetical protein
MMDKDEGRRHENDLVKGFTSFTGLVLPKDDTMKRLRKLGSRSLSCSSSSSLDDDGGSIVYDDDSHEEEKYVSHS